jgi:hypothetical protein
VIFKTAQSNSRQPSRVAAKSLPMSDRIAAVRDPATAMSICHLLRRRDPREHVGRACQDIHL